ncbi:(R)-mandelonitrile lyase 1-like [Cucumis melo var. makuwa]|uniref:(R)-mandelonitrile lyase 1-like n=1 Tax=Cucumis melo var. makuwa TaxID=1194695 RepID=A0A5D3DT41_CUCMM|nr:(R)-mandelonitrile lyase 1-like [Cucumis melo var. makuwa]TYK26947.1 (R)-mandelonitrile lyase 1-like [Cucumis melo var. makuwa]
MVPSLEVCSYNGCIIGGIRFSTLEPDSKRPTQNSGVMVIGEGSRGSADNNFYDVLDEVLHVQYPLERFVCLFKCRLFDTYNKKNHRTHVELVYKSINTSCFWFDEESVILATQTHQVFNDLKDEKKVDMYLELDDTFNNSKGSSSISNTSDAPQSTFSPTSRRRQHSQNLELEQYVQQHGKIPISIAPGGDKTISPQAIRFSCANRVLMSNTFSINALNWFELDFGDRALTPFEQSRVNKAQLERSSLTTTEANPCPSLNNNMISLKNEVIQWTVSKSNVGTSVLAHPRGFPTTIWRRDMQNHVG